MRFAINRIGPVAARAMIPLFAIGTGVTLLGAGLQVAQGMGLIVPPAILGQATIFGVLSKVGGVAIFTGLFCGALRVPRVDATRAAEPLAVPLSAQVRPAADLIRPQRVRPRLHKEPAR